jgi:pyruvate formate lyase activating enzyme
MQSDDVIVGWLKNSFIDFPGTVSTVLFFRGCNCRCPYCHNPRIVRGDDPAISFLSIKEHLQKRRGLIEGVVLSGGEPTIHPALVPIADEIRMMGLQIKLDTNGLLPEVIDQCSPDYLAMDLKTDPSRYNEIGAPFENASERIMKSLSIVKDMGENAEVRITVAPGFIDETTACAMAVMLRGAAKVFLQQFQNDVELLDMTFMDKTPVPIERIRAYREIIAPHVGECRIRGYEE